MRLLTLYALLTSLILPTSSWYLPLPPFHLRPPTFLRSTSTPSSAFDLTSTLYDILSTPPDTPHSDLKKAFIRQAKLHHPDSNPTAFEGDFERVREAYDVLSDVKAR